MIETKTILVIGTYDTKSDELAYLTGRIEAQGGKTLTMDVSVLGDPPEPTGISKHQVAGAAGSTGSLRLAAPWELTWPSIAPAHCPWVFPNTLFPPCRSRR